MEGWLGSSPEIGVDGMPLLENWLRGRIAVLLGARFLAYRLRYVFVAARLVPCTPSRSLSSLFFEGAGR